MFCDFADHFLSFAPLILVQFLVPRLRPMVGVSRAAALLAASSASLSCKLPTAATTSHLTLPLELTAGGVLTTGVFIDGEPFRVIIDTGSPYLVVPVDDCNTQPPRISVYGCAAPDLFAPAPGRAGTSEQYGALAGQMQWLRGCVVFGDTELEQAQDGSLRLQLRFREQGGRAGLVFGGGDRNVMSQSGGALLGLIREVNHGPRSTISASDLRPTVLSQLGLSSYRLNAPQRTLTLSSAPMIAPPSEADALPLVDPRLDGDGVEHACCRVDGDELLIDGIVRRARRPILCVFDSGLSGLVLSQSLVDELGLADRVTAAAGRRVRSVQLGLLTERGRRVELRSGVDASALFYTQAIPLNWFVDSLNGPHVVAVGQCVLGRGTLTVDSVTRRATWEPA